MGFFLKPKLSQRYLHTIMLPSIGLIFLASNYVIFTEVGPILQWNVSFFWFYALLLLGFGISWIYAVAINKAYQKVQAKAIEKESTESALQSKLKTLSRKEHEVLNLILERKNNQQICDTLFISLSTLKSHINHIYKKLEVNRRQEILELLG